MSNIPNHLKHKPIYVIENYDLVDGQYKGKNNTDVKGISLGKAQWSSNIFVPSVKVWRHTGNRWSRQSEETTLTRALDMATLVVKVLDKYFNKRTIQSIDTIFGSVNIIQNNSNYENELADYLDKNKNEMNVKDLEAHLEILYQALKQYKGE